MLRNLERRKEGLFWEVQIWVSTEVHTPTVPSEVHFRLTPSLELSYTPGGSDLWVRKIEMEFTPKVGMLFKTVKEGTDFYQIYALACGFKSRLSTAKTFRDGKIRTNAIVCNRQGFKERRKKPAPSTKNRNTASSSENSNTAPSTENSNTENSNTGPGNNPPPKDPKKTKITRFGCRAWMKLVYDPKQECYFVKEFVEGHNHTLCSVRNREFQKLSKNLSLYHKQTILDHSKVNIGPTQTYRICKEYVDGYSNIGASLAAFKNFQRDVKGFIGSKDGQLFVDTLQKLSDTHKGFYYAYDKNNEDNLTKVFWCDAQARKNYPLFGDTISYDPTYGKNKYCLVFTPLNGVDNHKKSITFGAALLSNEDEQSFRWVFTKFLTAMGNKEPQCILTDQDPAIKNAVPAVFKQAHHRFCMWHIMQKLNDKVGQTISKET
ncbi:hypothetical protein RND81_01G100100 [Saponaria officinalis]|uniref:Protein FAR1-RELATED SEQUENCE n=1 Tax=Saponaria officinalis TaxID=3572 RepID=A0AAW1NHQ2_SAPOF